MTPRRPDSKNWTALPAEFTEKAQIVFTQNFHEESKKGQFSITGKIFPREILLRAGFGEKGQLRHANFEVSLDHSPDQKAMDKLFFGVDVLGSVFETHFDHLREAEVDDIEYPIQWQEFEFEGSTVYLRFSTENTHLEAEADRLLGLADEALYQDEEVLGTEDALDRAEIDAELAKEVSKALRSGEYRPRLSEEQESALNASTGVTSASGSDQESPLH